MACPECGNIHVDMVKQDTPDQGSTQLEQYECDECGCEWEWNMERTITKHGKNFEEE